MITIHLIVAARPNFMTIAPLYHALKATDRAAPVFVHTGQHYDHNMSDVILRDSQIQAPDFHLGVGSSSHAEQTGNVMIAYEKVCLEHQPDWIVVVGDVNSKAVGAKVWIPVVHLEAGLRSRDRRMHEEINRLVTDAIAEVLCAPSEDGDENLLNEGVPADKIDRICNIMIDSFEMLRDSIETASTAVESLHVVFVAHSRTIKGLEKFGFSESLEGAEDIELLEPVAYVRFMSLVTGARVMITDLGGLQQETSYLGIPCLTLLENTERPVTIALGTNGLSDAASLADDLGKVLVGDWKQRQPLPLWDGKASKRAAASLERRSRERAE